MPVAADQPVVRTVAIIGAGWSGLQIADVLRDCGYEVRLFETLDDVGGTWHPATAYAGLSIHTPAFRAEFKDFPYPEGTHPLHRLPSSEVFAYCKAFADDRGLRDRIRFRHRVDRLDYRTDVQRCDLTITDETTGTTEVASFDFVVSTQFNAPRMPDLANGGFAGEVLHSNDLKDEVADRIIAERRRVVLLGASKSATDIALELSRRGYPFKWLMRKMYWFLSYDRVYWDFGRNRTARLWSRFLYVAGLGLARTPRLTRMVFSMWRRAGLIVCPGRVHSDYNRFHHGWLDNTQAATLARLDQVEGEIDRIEGDQVVLTDGRRLACDTLVCATGCDPIAAPVHLAVDGRPLAYDAIDAVYRLSVIPAIPRLVFTGYWTFGFGPLNGYHRAAWIMQHIERALPSAVLTQAAVAEADPPGATVFRSGSALFDSSRNLILTMAKANDLMMEGLYTRADLRRYFVDLSVRHVFRPFRGVERFLAARRKRASPEGEADRRAEAPGTAPSVPQAASQHRRR